MQINEEELVNQIKGFVSENLELSSMSDEQLEEKIDRSGVQLNKRIRAA